MCAKIYGSTAGSQDIFLKKANKVSLQPRNIYNQAQYDEKLYEFIKARESSGDPQPKVYLDTKGLPTIGVGYLIDGKDWQRDFREAGLSLTDKQIQDFKNLLKNLSSTNNKEQKKEYIKIYNAKSDAIKLTASQEQKLFNNIIDGYKNIVKTKLGDQVYNDLDNSDEMISLVSLAYNNPELIGQKLVNAIKEGNRAEAWYEIRYNSNAKREHGIQNRRTFESDNFGLYQNAQSKSEATNVLKVLKPRMIKIDKYLAQCYDKNSKEKHYELTDFHETINEAKNIIDKTRMFYDAKKFEKSFLDNKIELSNDDTCLKM